ncbi:MAG TPA: alkane 1-monooxygenase [Caulobacteraceae bacterium]|jgi:alkane 1-monooxygenase
MAAAKFWSAFAFLALIPIGWRLGGAWTFLLVGALPLVLVALDWMGGPESQAPAPAAPYRLLPYLYIPLQLAALAWGGWLVAQPSTPLLEDVGLTLSMGVACGVFGFISAHEMIHSHKPGERWLGLAMLAGMLDMPFAIAHVQGHHRRAATHEDPATARRGESLYGFVIRSVAGQVGEAWEFETRRLARNGRSALGPGNRLLGYALVEVALVVAVGLWSWRALAYFVADAALAIFLLEAFNYIAHYGLMRRPGPGGRLEPLRPRHSWNSRRRMNNAALFNMGRHADHHRFSARPYHELEVLDGGSMLPCGYAGVLLLATIPPLFRRVMDPRVDAVMADAEAARIAAE